MEDTRFHQLLKIPMQWLKNFSENYSQFGYGPAKRVCSPVRAQSSLNNISFKGRRIISLAGGGTLISLARSASFARHPSTVQSGSQVQVRTCFRCTSGILLRKFTILRNGNLFFFSKTLIKLFVSGLNFYWFAYHLNFIVVKGIQESKKLMSSSDTLHIINRG